VLPRAAKVPTHRVEISAPYGYLERLRLLIRAHQGKILQEEFAAEVTIGAQFTVERFSAFLAALGELSNGTLTADVLETNEATIMPIGADEVHS
jgi:putative IMPACT (imprinted ancient) family translation regulator